MIPEWINDYIGLPFEARGRSREGIDCYGLFWLIYRERMSIFLPDHLEKYKDIEDKLKIASAVIGEKKSENWQPIEGPATFGNLVLFTIPKCVFHMGMMIDDHRFIHSQERTDSCIESIRGLLWSRRVMGVFRYAG